MLDPPSFHNTSGLENLSSLDFDEHLGMHWEMENGDGPLGSNPLIVSYSGDALGDGEWRWRVEMGLWDQIH